MHENILLPLHRAPKSVATWPQRTTCASCITWETPLWPLLSSQGNPGRMSTTLWSFLLTLTHPEESSTTNCCITLYFFFNFSDIQRWTLENYFILKNITLLCNKHLCAVDREGYTHPPPRKKMDHWGGHAHVWPCKKEITSHNLNNSCYKFIEPFNEWVLLWKQKSKVIILTTVVTNSFAYLRK